MNVPLVTMTVMSMLTARIHQALTHAHVMMASTVVKAAGQGQECVWVRDDCQICIQ